MLIIGIILSIGVVVIVIIPNVLNIEIKINSEFSWIIVIISILTATSTPYSYEKIKRYRKRQNLKKFWRNKLKLVKDANVKYNNALLKIIKDVILNLEKLEIYVIDAYNKFEHKKYLCSIEILKEGL